MKRDYIFKNQNNTPFIYDSSIERVVRSYETTLQIASNVILPLLNSSSFALKLLNEEYINDHIKLFFEASANSKKLTITILSDYFIINCKDEIYTYRYDWNKSNFYLQLISYTKKIGNRTIYQKIESHHLKLEITISNKKFRLEIPYDINYYLDPKYFSILKETTSIMDLIKIYQNRFLPGQNQYEKTLESTVTISKLEDGEEILLDQVILKSGFIDSYYLSSIKGNTQISIKGSINEKENIIIRNYENPEEISLDEEIRNLYYQSKRLWPLIRKSEDTKRRLL